MASQRHRTPSIAPQPVTQKTLQTAAQSKQYWRNQPQVNWEDRPIWEVETPEPFKPAYPTFRGLSQEWMAAGMVIQPKLTIGQPNDQYEQEADRVAEQVVQRLQSPQLDRPQSGETVQRETLPDDDELQMKPLAEQIQRVELPDDDELQMKSVLQRETDPDEEDELQMKPMSVQRSPNGAMEASADLERAIAQKKGSGSPLADTIREPMEQAFGADYSKVTVHTDSQSDQLNRSIRAKAFTNGKDIFFRQGAYQPSSQGGQELLAHELTHVAQQNGGGSIGSNTDKQRESAADGKEGTHRRTQQARGIGGGIVQEGDRREKIVGEAGTDQSGSTTGKRKTLKGSERHEWPERARATCSRHGLREPADPAKQRVRQHLSPTSGVVMRTVWKLNEYYEWEVYLETQAATEAPKKDKRYYMVGQLVDTGTKIAKRTDPEPQRKKKKHKTIKSEFAEQVLGLPQGAAVTAMIVGWYLESEVGDREVEDEQAVQQGHLLKRYEAANFEDTSENKGKGKHIERHR